MEFTIENLGEPGRGAKVEKQQNGTHLTLSVGFIGSHAGYAFLTRSEALALADVLRAMAESLDQSEG